MSLYIGTNYHPHDWPRERWKTDVELMKQAGFTTVRLGHLCWDSYEPEDGVYTFEWFDEVMDLFAQAGIGVVLDVSMRPAPVWVHKLCPGCNIHDRSGILQPSVRRYMEDVADPAYQYYALRFAEILVKRYRNHPALFAFGLCNELGSGQRSYSEQSRQRFIQWLKHKYGTVEKLNRAWATQRWSRRLTSFDDVVFPENGIAIGAPEACLDMRRFFSNEIGSFIIKLKETVEHCAPEVPHSSNHYAELEALGFDYLNTYDEFVDYPGMGFYPGYQITERYHFMNNNYYLRLAETGKPMWILEFQVGGQGVHHGPYGTIRMQAMLSLLNRSQMILGWTWRSMLAGEEQYLCGILGHDGIPTVNYQEYQEIARYMQKLQKYAFPYLPHPEIAVAWSYDNDRVIQYGSAQYHQTVRQNFVEVQRVFYDLNLDYNIIGLKNRKQEYKLLLLPGYVLMSEEEAAEVRRFVEQGGIAIMTAYSAMVDEHNQVFSTPRPGRLGDVFGIRVAGFDRTGSLWRDFAEDAKLVEDEKGKRELLKVAAGDEFYIDVEYYEELELHTAKEYAVFADKGCCAVSVNMYGKGKAYYVAAEMNTQLLKWLIKKIAISDGLKEGMKVPEGIQAREIAPGQRFYVNTTNRTVKIPLEKAGKGVISEGQYQDILPLKPYDVELVLE